VSREIRVLGFAGSLRRQSHNVALLHAAVELAPDEVEIETHDLTAIPLYNADVEATAFPQSVERFKERIAAADALLIVTPEYNGSLPGVLKNAIDWATRPSKQTPFYGKPAAVLGAGGPFGTVRAQRHLREILQARNMAVMPKPDLYITHATEKFDAEGRLVDETTREAVRALLAAFADWIRHFLPQAVRT
jgi:chromate reductase, NAD(P)H dehydrogenase (quinone)